MVVEDGQVTEEVVEETQGTESEVTETEQVEATEPEEYVPDFGYKAYDESREMDDWARPLVTNKEIEENLRGLYSKAGGFDTLKEQHGALKNDYAGTVDEYNQLADRIEELDHLMANSPAMFFKEIGLSDERIIQYVQGLLAQKDMSSEEIQRLQAQDQSVLQSFHNDRRASVLESQNMELQQNQIKIGIDQAMTDPRVSEVQQAYDARMGAGAFRQEVVNQGKHFYQTNGYDTTGPDAVRMAFEKWQPMFAKGDSEQPQGINQKPKGHIPNVGSGDGNVSPTKARFNSIDALKKHAQEKEQQAI